MTREAFERLVQKAEALAARSPRAYRLRVAALGALGYLYVWMLVVLALILAALIVPVLTDTGITGASGLTITKVLIPLLAFVWILLKALWVHMEAPTGRPLPARDYPELHDLLARIRAAFRGPRIHEVLMDDQLNASITQVPRLGVLGWHRNYLAIGLPLLLGMSRPEAEAILAHEYGHLSGDHGKLGSWIYRIRMTWVRLMEAFHERRGRGSALVRRFCDWYAPYFQAYSFALARSNEYAADRNAAAFAGANQIASALQRLSVLGPYLDLEYWAAILSGADGSPTPPDRPFAELARVGFAPVSGRAAEYLESALHAPTGHSDTHPSLADRLAALGVEPRPPGPIEEPAAASLLGVRLPDILGSFDATWRERVTPWFEERYRHVQSSKARLAELDPRDSALEVDELIERATILDDLQGREAALPVYREVLELEPDHALAGCIVGFAAVLAGDETGEEMMEAAMRRDPGLLLQGLQALRDHYAQAGDAPKAERFHERLLQRRQELERIRAERRLMPFKPVYDPPDLSETSMAAIRRVLNESRRVRRAYLARKRVELSDTPCYVLAVAPRVRFTVRDDRTRLGRLLAESVSVPEEVFIVMLGKRNARLGRILRNVNGSRVL